MKNDSDNLEKQRFCDAAHIQLTCKFLESFEPEEAHNKAVMMLGIMLSTREQIQEMREAASTEEGARKQLEISMSAVKEESGE